MTEATCEQPYAYRPTPPGNQRVADILVHSGRVVTMDAERTVLEDGYVLVSDGRIAEIGSTRDGDGLPNALERIDARGGIIMPGLIDTHFHTEQQFLRGGVQALAKARALKLPVWRNYFIPFELSLSDEDAYLSALAAYVNLLSVGTTCFAEPGGPHPDAMARAALEVGVRGVIAFSTVDQGVPPSLASTTDDALRRNVETVERWNGAGAGRLRAWFGLRQVLVSSPTLYREFARLAEKLDVRIHTHLGEGQYEIDYCLEKWGKRPCEYLESIGFLSERVHAAHVALLSDREVDVLRRNNVSCAHCPSPNLILFGAPKIPYMLEKGIRVGLASDGASHGSVDLFKQMAVAHAGLNSHFGAPYYDRDAIRDGTLLEMATSGAAKALGWDHEIGSIEVGKRADIIVVGTSEFDVAPAYDVEFTLVRAASGRDVRTVIVDGKVVMRDREILTVNVDGLRVAIKNRFGLDRIRQVESFGADRPGEGVDGGKAWERM